MIHMASLLTSELKSSQGLHAALTKACMRMQRATCIVQSLLVLGVDYNGKLCERNPPPSVLCRMPVFQQREGMMGRRDGLSGSISIMQWDNHRGHFSNQAIGKCRQKVCLSILARCCCVRCS